MFSAKINAFILIFTMGFILSSYGCSHEKGGKGGNEVLAIIDGKPIRYDDLSNRARTRMAQADTEHYRERVNALEGDLNNQLLSLEAKKLNISTEELQKREIDEKVPMVTQQEVDDYFKMNKERIDQYLKNFKGKDKPSTADLKEAIRGQIATQRQRERYGNYMKELRGKYKVEIALKAPEAPRVQIAAGDNPAKGPADAKVKIIEFSDFACPYCMQVVSTLKKIEEDYGDKVQIVFRDFPLPMHQTAQKQAEAGGCAHEQAKFWEYHDKIFTEPVQTKLREVHQKKGLPGIEEELIRLSKDFGADEKQFADCLKSSKFAAEVKADQRAGDEAGVQSTPSFFINGRLVAGALPYTEFKRMIDEELNR